MVTTVEALPYHEFQAWLAATSAGATGTADPAAHGADLAQQLGCLGCHSVDGTPRVGPSLKGVFGQPRAVTHNGGKATVSADAAYLTRAIRAPGEEVVDGYPPVMPPYPQLSADELQALLAWMERLK
jgi:cytochrome c oxidase subunit 2